MERTRVLKPGSTLSDSKGPDYYDIIDLHIGARLQVLSHHFVLLDADEYVFNYMEEDGKRFKYSNKQIVYEKVSKLLRELSGGDKEFLMSEFKKIDKTNSGVIERQELIKLSKSFFPGILSDHELVTFSRKFEVESRKPKYLNMLLN
jgi:hypothetical protein